MKAAVITLALAVLLPLPAAATDGESNTSAKSPSSVERPTVVRRYVNPGVKEATAYAELIDLKHVAEPADTVDAVADLVPTLGKANSLMPIPVKDLRGTAMLFLFRGKKSVAAIIEDRNLVQGSSGRHACRIVNDASFGPPDPMAYTALARWCVHAIALANLDATFLAR